MVAGVSALMVAIGMGLFANTPILSTTQERFDLSNAAANTRNLRFFEYAF
jgi:hypothetical protein